ncbi:MAG TPA: hypothetical protein VEY92_01340, partial [Pseudoxanthomonas sp.]|nr:hypothetical protein [Pseudoxanthomonas sp.]
MASIKGLLSASILTVLATAPAYAQDAGAKDATAREAMAPTPIGTPRNPPAESTTTKLDTMVVTGLRGSLAS